MKFFVVSLIVVGLTVFGTPVEARAGGVRLIKKSSGNVTIKGLNPKQIKQMKQLAGKYSSIKFNQRGNTIILQGSPKGMKNLMGKTTAILPTINGMGGPYLGTGSSEGDVNQGNEQDEGANDRSADQNSNASSAGKKKPKKIATLTNITPSQLTTKLKAFGIRPSSVEMVSRGANVQITASPRMLQQIKNFAGQNRFNAGTSFRPGI